MRRKSTSSNDLDWQEYEMITKYIYEMLGAEYGIKVIGHGAAFKVQGKSGVKHQVDVLTEQFEGERRHLTAIECKFLKRKVTKEIVMKLYSIMVDGDIANGIIVCKMGFTKDTLTYAEHLGIRLVQLREALQEAVDGESTINIGTLEIHSHIAITRPNIISIDLGSIQITGEDEIMAMYYSHYATILTPEGRKIPFNKYLYAYCDELCRDHQILKTVTINYPTVNGKLIRRYTDDQPDIKKISFSGFLYKKDASSKRSFQLVDQVWMIMKEIFENKVYKFSRSGMLYRGIDRT